MHCRAVYEEDGIEYEAVLKRVINDKECVVCFIGKYINKGHSNPSVVETVTLMVFCLKPACLWSRHMISKVVFKLKPCRQKLHLCQCMLLH